ncbi:hypothetical protein [Lysobacter tyrosinilyticus]
MRTMSALIVLLLALTACAAPTPNGNAAMPASGSASEQPASPSDNHEPAPAAKPVAIDMTCKTDADCTVKNVGNCCGYYPACVNVNSPTDPKGVQAECAKKGVMSVCGFPDISACACKQGRCEAASGNLQVQ